MAATLRAVAAATTRILCPAVLQGQGLRRLVHTQQQHSTPARALEEGYRGSQIQQKKEELYTASQLHMRPVTTAKKAMKWVATAFLCVTGVIAFAGISTTECVHKQDGATDCPRCQGCGNPLPKRCVYCGRLLPRPRAQASQAA